MKTVVCGRFCTYPRGRSSRIPYLRISIIEDWLRIGKREIDKESHIYIYVVLLNDHMKSTSLLFTLLIELLQRA